ncbi:unnamed protein product [Victoria cruziana]
MECNKEEATRALEVAEAKLQKHDLEGARRLVQKAQRLFPSLSRIPQMSALLDVLVAGPNCGGGCVEPDWYTVLGLPDPSAPLAVIKKKYHAMALLLHPDKNASRSADEGFKLVAQAWAVLSNASTRSAYDSRRAASRVKSACRPSHDDGSKAPRPAAEENGGGTLGIATSLCPHCKKISDVLEHLVGHLIQCKYCEKLFLAIKHNPNDKSSTGGKHDGPLPQDRNNHCKRNMETKENVSQAGIGKEDGESQQEVLKKHRTSKRKRPNCNGQDEKGKEDAVPTKKVKTTMAKKANGDERSEKTTRNAAPVKETEANFDDQCQGSTGKTVPVGKKKVHESPRNATCAKGRRVNGDVEDEKEEGNAVPTKSFDDVQHGKSAEDATPERGTEPSGDGCSGSAANISTRTRTREKERVNYSESRGRKRSHGRTKREKVSVPDADFCSFSEEISAEKFEEGQIWALYDDDDQMPRFYGYVKRIFSKDPFKVKIQWLEAKTDESRAIENWIDAGFYLGCGEFELGDCKILHGIESFSHQIFCWENTTDGSFRVIPGKGEVWALYKEWNASWNGSESLETLHAYEIVEIATEFDANAGFEVIPLAKLKNYVSVFRRENRKMVVPVHEKLRFSHSMPFKELSGDEDHRLPKNCLQLDTAALNYGTS